MYTLKSIARRGSLIGASVAMLAAVVLPTAAAFADTLNPLTDRSLLLSSSAPGFQESDGSGNTDAIRNAVGEYYAPPGSGANGKKTGETFSFKISTPADTRAIEAFTLQYCTSAAGNCQAPGDNSGDARDDLPAPRSANGDEVGKSDLEAVYNTATSTHGDTATDEFGIYVNGVLSTANWTVTTSNVEDTAHSGNLTGKDNFITLASDNGGITTAAANAEIRIVFRASDTDYITNPGSGAFFVRMNTYDTDNTALHIPTVPADTNTNIIDGGVTVANVMTESIHITTKVLETMQFSVGTVNPDTQATTHGTCDPLPLVEANRLNLGDPDAEYSLRTDMGFDVYSYWRLASNSSGGASVYYSGNTLTNTVGDEITPIGATAALSQPSTEQFGLAFVGSTYGDTLDPAFVTLVAGTPGYKNPELEGLDGANRVTAYRDGEGVLGRLASAPGGAETATASFAFEKESNLQPRLLTSDDTSVVSCATAKMRYVANIAANTPAGIYTTKINYLAAPQY